MHPTGNTACFPTMRRPPGSHWPWPSIFWVNGFLWRGREEETKFLRRNGVHSHLSLHSQRCPLHLSLCFLVFFQLPASETSSDQWCRGKRRSCCGKASQTDRNWNRDCLREARHWPPPSRVCASHLCSFTFSHWFPYLSSTSPPRTAAPFSLSRWAPLLRHEHGRGWLHPSSHIWLKFKQLAENRPARWETMESGAHHLCSLEEQHGRLRLFPEKGHRLSRYPNRYLLHWDIEDRKFLIPRDEAQPLTGNVNKRREVLKPTAASLLNLNGTKRFVLFQSKRHLPGVFRGDKEAWIEKILKFSSY